MKVLSIGNSFSQDAHKWLHQLAQANGVEMETVNLFIGGCSLQTHWTNVAENNAYYDLEINGGLPVRKISIREALDMDTWDVVTLQQVSQLSGMPESYEPYFSLLLQEVRTRQPKAKIWFHKTWAYEMDSVHPGFSNYDRDQEKMYTQIQQTVDQVAKRYELPVIPSGDAVQYIRRNVPEFQYGKGGKSLCRDGFHMSYDYGRYAVAAAWLATLTGKPVIACPVENLDRNLLEKLVSAVNAVCMGH